MVDATDRIVLEYTPEYGPRRRVRLTTCTSERGAYWRIEEVLSGCGWRETGREAVDDVEISVSSASTMTGP
ncbi:hypothetical protein [Halospeciosus flavus]|uniref:Uncharacterized protein n=1 Tax=Halospeciosus flavus TaxID=3032283 RepID=A0ABD5Z6F4_9EURY